MPYGTPQSNMYAARRPYADGNAVRNRSSEQRFSGSGNPAMPIFNTKPPSPVRYGGGPVAGDPTGGGGDIGGPGGYASDGTYQPPTPGGGSVTPAPGLVTNPATTTPAPWRGRGRAPSWNPALRALYEAQGATAADFQPPMPTFNGGSGGGYGGGYRPPPAVNDPRQPFNYTGNGYGNAQIISGPNSEPFMPAPVRGIPGSVGTWGTP